MIINRVAEKGITAENARRLTLDYLEEEDLSARCILQLDNITDNWQLLTTILFNLIVYRKS